MSTIHTGGQRFGKNKTTVPAPGENRKSSIGIVFWERIFQNNLIRALRKGWNGNREFDLLFPDQGAYFSGTRANDDRLPMEIEGQVTRSHSNLCAKLRRGCLWKSVLKKQFRSCFYDFRPQKRRLFRSCQGVVLLYVSLTLFWIYPIITYFSEKRNRF